MDHDLLSDLPLTSVQNIRYWGVFCPKGITYIINTLPNLRDHCGRGKGESMWFRGGGWLLGNIIFWPQQHSCVYELTVAVIACTNLCKVKKEQTSAEEGVEHIIPVKDVEQLAIVSWPSSVFFFVFFFKTLVPCKSTNYTPVGNHICKNTGQYRLKNLKLAIYVFWRVGNRGWIMEELLKLSVN